MPHRTYASSAAHTLRPTQAPSSTTATTTQTLTSTPVLRLRATASLHQSTQRPNIRWADDVVDNEGLGRKSSKVCCIYHAPRQVGESSDESSSSSDESSSDEQDSSDDDGAARMSGNRRAKWKPKHEHGDAAEDSAQSRADGNQDHNHDHSAKKARKRRTGNAYERMPKSKGNSTTVIERRS